MALRTDGSEGSRPASWERAAVAVASAPVFLLVARARVVDDDEGFYALAGRAVAHGELPYHDFFFPQLPLGAAFYGAVNAVLGAGLAPLRAVTALLAVVTTLLVHHAARREAGALAGACAAVLFVAHALVWEWAVTVKTFPLALCLGTAALVVATAPALTARGAALAGTLAGLTVAARGLSLPIAVAVAVALWARSPGGVRPRTLGVAAASGYALALLPVGALFVLDPGAAYFDNVTYHALRSPGDGLVKDVAQKLATLAEVFVTPLGASRADATGLQSTPLALALVLAWRSGSRAVRPFVVAAGLVAAVALLPSPAWTQYFVAAVPPACVAAGIWLAGRASPRAVVAALAGYVLVAAPAFVERVVRAEPLLRPGAVDAVARALDAVTPPSSRVAAHFPAYLVASARAPLGAATNQFARLVADRVMPPERARFHLFTEEEFRDALLRGEASAFVVGAFTVPATALALKSAGWRQAAAPPGATIWVPGASK